MLNSPSTEEVKCHKMMKENMDLHLEFLKQTSSLNTMMTPLMQDDND